MEYRFNPGDRAMMTGSDSKPVAVKIITARPKVQFRGANGNMIIVYRVELPNGKRQTVESSGLTLYPAGG